MLLMFKFAGFYRKECSVLTQIKYLPFASSLLMHIMQDLLKMVFLKFAPVKLYATCHFVKQSLSHYFAQLCQLNLFPRAIFKKIALTPHDFAESFHLI